MASKNIGWVTVDPSSGTGTETVNISGRAYEGRGLRSQTLWFNPTNSTEVESVQFNIKQFAKALLFDDFKQGSTAVTLENKTASKSIGQGSTSLAYSFKTNAKAIYIQVLSISGTGDVLQITNVKINNVSVESSAANVSGAVIIHTPANDPGATGSYTVQFTVNIGANTGTVDRRMVLFIAGADDDTSTSDFNAAYVELRAVNKKECFANINITQSYSKPSVTITGTGVVKGDDGVYTTNTIPVDGSVQSFTIQASDGLAWSIDEVKKTPTLDEPDFPPLS